MPTSLYTNQKQNLNVSGQPANVKNSKDVISNAKKNSENGVKSDELTKGVFLTEVLTSPKFQNNSTPKKNNNLEPKNKKQLLPPVQNISAISVRDNQKRVEELRKQNDLEIEKKRLLKKKKSLLQIPLRSERSISIEKLISNNYSKRFKENKIFHGDLPSPPKSTSSSGSSKSHRHKRRRKHANNQIEEILKESMPQLSPKKRANENNSAGNVDKITNNLPPIRSPLSSCSTGSSYTSRTCSTCYSKTSSHSQRIEKLEEKLKAENEAKQDIQKAIEIIKSKQDSLLSKLSNEEKEMLEKNPLNEEPTNEPVNAPTNATTNDSENVEKDKLNEKLQQTQQELQNLQTLVTDLCNQLVYATLGGRTNKSLKRLITTVYEKYPHIIKKTVDELEQELSEEDYRPRGPTFRTSYCIDHRGSIIFS